MPIVESYSFGHMVVDGKTFTKDIILYPDNTILSPWWRKSGHRLEVSDITTLIDMEPEVIIAGTGASGLMRPSDELRQVLQEKGIAFTALPTGKALDEYNTQAKSKRAGACFHLTC